MVLAIISFLTGFVFGAVGVCVMSLCSVSGEDEDDV